MNAGAYGGEIAHILQSCQILTKEGKSRPYLPRIWLLVTAIQLFRILGLLFCQLNLPSSGKHQVIKQEMDRLTHLRELKQPRIPILWFSL